MRVRITSTARKHGINSNRIRAALNTATYITSIDDADYYIGVDSYGVELELIMVPDNRHPDRMAVIHAMPLHYREKEE